MTDQILRLIPFGNAGYHRALAGSVVQREFEQLLRALDVLATEHLRDHQLHLHEIVDRDLRDSLGSLRCRFFVLFLSLRRNRRGNQLIQLFDLLIHIDAREQRFALCNDSICRQKAPCGRVLVPQNRCTCTELLLNLGSGVRHKRGDENGDDAQCFTQMVHHRSQPCLLVFVLAEHPRRGLVNIFIGARDDLPDFRQRIGELIGIDRLIAFFAQGDHRLLELVVDGGLFLLGGNHSAEIFAHHGGGAGNQIAQIVGQIGIDAADQSLVGKVAVGSERDFAQQEIPDGIHAVAVAQNHRVNHVALALAHLASVAKQQPAVAVHLLRQGKIHRHQNGRPDDRMETYDLLADKVNIRGPVLAVIRIVVGAVAHGGDIIGQRVQPHIHNVLGVKVHGDSPGKAGAGNTQVVQTALDELDHLVFAAFGLNEVRLVLIQLEELVRIVGKAEEISFLLRPLDLAAAVGAFAVFELRFRPESLTGGTVPAFVFALVDFTLIVKRAENLLHGFLVVIIRGADKTVVADIQKLPKVAEAFYHLIYIFLGGNTLFFRIVLNFLAVLVRAGQEHHVIPLQALITGNRVAGHGAVAVPDMRLPGGVINRSGDIKCLFFHRIHPFNKFSALFREFSDQPCRPCRRRF